MTNQNGNLPPSIRSSVRQQTERMLYTGQRFMGYDQIRQRHFWSSAFFNINDDGYVNQGIRSLFTTPPGQNGQGFPSGIVIGDRESNWPSANRVPDNQNIEVTEIGIGLLPPIGEDGEILPLLMRYWPRVQSEFLNNTVVNIKYLTNSVPLGMAADFAQASGNSPGLYAVEGPTEVDGEGPALELPVNYGHYLSTNGFAAPALRRRFKIPILLQHGETFSFELEVPRTYFAMIAGTIPPNPLFGITARLDIWATESFVEKS